MRFIPTRIHGVIDYIAGIFLIGMPWFLGFYSIGAESYIPILLGILAIAYSLFTNYELGVIRLFSVRTHLLFDLLSGVLLASSPWIFGFADRIYLPHVIVGGFEILASLLTQKEPKSTPAHPDHVQTAG